jgi:hypothetical protein
MSDYQALIQDDVFHTTKQMTQADSAQAPEEKPVQVTTLNLKLKGVVLRDGSRSFAAIMDGATRKEDIYYLNDTVQGARIVKILRDQVILQVNNTQEALLLFTQSDDKEKGWAARPGAAVRQPRPSRDLPPSTRQGAHWGQTRRHDCRPAGKGDDNEMEKIERSTSMACMRSVLLRAAVCRRPFPEPRERAFDGNHGRHGKGASAHGSLPLHGGALHAPSLPGRPSFGLPGLPHVGGALPGGIPDPTPQTADEREVRKEVRSGECGVGSEEGSAEWRVRSEE